MQHRYECGWRIRCIESRRTVWGWWWWWTVVTSRRMAVIVIMVIVVLVLVLVFVVVVIVVIVVISRGLSSWSWLRSYHGGGHIVVVLLLQLWSWLRTGCTRIMVVNKMSKNSNESKYLPVGHSSWPPATYRWPSIFNRGRWQQTFLSMPKPKTIGGGKMKEMLGAPLSPTSIRLLFFICPQDPHRSHTSSKLTGQPYTYVMH